MRKLVVIVFLLVSGVVSGQSVTGTSGLIHIPSARMLEDGQLVLGTAYIPKPYFRSTASFDWVSESPPRRNSGLNTYITYGILPFIELMFRYSHELNMKVNTETEYFPDRMFSVRVRIINETKNLPSIVFGLQDMGTLLGGTNSWFSANYIVGSKRISTSFGNLDTTFGFAFDFLDTKTRDYKGIFGGISYTPSFYNKISINFEHNSNGINTGFRLNAFSRFNILLGIWNLDKPTFSFNYLF